MKSRRQSSMFIGRHPQELLYPDYSLNWPAIPGGVKPGLFTADAGFE